MKSFGQESSVPLPTADLPVWQKKEQVERFIPRIMKTAVEAEFLLQWGSRKRLRCVRVRGQNPAQVSSSSNTNANTPSSSRTRRRLNSRFTVSHKGESFPQSTSRLTRNTEMETLRSESRKSSSRSPEKEERYYTTRGSNLMGLEENSKIMVDGGSGKLNHAEDHHHHHLNNVRKSVWPKLCIALSSKEKEEDFLAMKGCKLPQRPKKRAKLIQRSLLLVSPGAWLTDMSLERYEVREKKSSKRKGRGGLKAMGSIESDSE